MEATFCLVLKYLLALVSMTWRKISFTLYWRGLPNAPSGTKGISLFIVPKYNVEDDGAIGSRNNVLCTSIEKKMGIHGSATCVLNFDEAKDF